MNRGLGRLILLIGTISYAVIGVLALLSWMANVGIFSVATLGIAAQIALALPLVAFLFGGQKMPVLPYAKWLAALVSVMAVAGMLGVPEGTHGHDDIRRAIAAKQSDVAEDQGARERLVLQKELAEADKDDKKDIEEKIKDLDKELSDKEKEELARKAAGLQAEESIARFDEAGRVSDLINAERRNVLMLIAAFIVLAGAWLMDREDTVGPNETVLMN